MGPHGQWVQLFLCLCPRIPAGQGSELRQTEKPSAHQWPEHAVLHTGQVSWLKTQKHNNTTAKEVSVFTGVLFFLFFVFLNRREVYRILQEEGIDLPRYAVLNRDPDKPDGETDGSYSVFRQKKHNLRAQWCKTTLISFQHVDEFWIKRVTVARAPQRLIVCFVWVC